MKNYVAYYRVSTQKQGKSGLGLDAQRDAVRRFAQSGVILKEFTEIESGKRNDRAELRSAIVYAKEHKATLLIAKLDRLSRSVKLIFDLRDTGVDFVCCDLPDANTLTIGIFATFAQHEAERISQRTKDGLRQAKLRGTVLGTPGNLDATARAKGLEKRKQNAKDNSSNRQAAALITSLRKQGNSLQTIASELNRLDMKTRRGKIFSATQVRRLLNQ